MEWLTTRQLRLQSVGDGSEQAQAAAFHPTQAILAVAVGRHIVEFDALTGCKLSSVDIGGSVVKLAYSPAGGHVLLAVLQDWTIRSWDLDAEHTTVLYSPASADRKQDRPASGAAVQAHIALTPMKPWLFFAAHMRTSVNVVGIRDGGKAALKLKTDYKKAVTQLACHPRAPLLFIAYNDACIRAHEFQTFGVRFTIQDPSLKLAGAGAITFHSTLDIMFVGDRGGMLLAWDIRVQPLLIGSVQVGSGDDGTIVSVAYHPLLQLVISLTKDGKVQVWRIRSTNNPNKPTMKSNFFEPSGMGLLDVADILTQQGGVAVYPVPKVVQILVHPRFNTATALFDSESSKEAGLRPGNLSRAARRELLAALQASRAAPRGKKDDAGAVTQQVIKEKLGGALFSDHHQMQLLAQQAQLKHGAERVTQTTVADYARKTFLYGSAKELHSTSGPVRSLPLLCIADEEHPLRDTPVCSPVQRDLHFFANEHRTSVYPPRADFMDGCTLCGFTLATGEYVTHKKLGATAASGAERYPTSLVFSEPQQAWAFTFACPGASSEVALLRTSKSPGGDGFITLPGRDATFTGVGDNQFLVLHEDGEQVDVLRLGPADVYVSQNGNGTEEVMAMRFDTPVSRVFRTPIDSSVLYVARRHMGLARIPSGAGYGMEPILRTHRAAGKVIDLKPMEQVLNVQWQSSGLGPVAGIVTTHRVLIADSNLDVVASSSAPLDSGHPPFRTCLWVGPALLVSTATTVAVLGWDGQVRPFCTLDGPNTALVGVLNDRLMLATRSEGGERGVEIKYRLVGLLEPLVIGYVTMQSVFDQNLELSETLYKLTSRFDNLRITPRMVDVLTVGSTASANLGVELAQGGPQFTQELRSRYAMRARRFETALTILRDDFLRSKDYPRCPPSSRLFQRFRELGKACVKYGQFDRAKETYEVAGDYESLFDLFITHMNPSALRRLAQKLEETKADPELLRQTQQLLLLRSAGWGTGGTFTQLSGDSMAPKGPEWGGGNWEIKVTPQEDKVPDWELASEVTAFMQDTAGAPIPNIVPDSLGVYLGTERGRGVAPPTGERFAAAAAAAASVHVGAPLAIGSDGAPLGFGDELEGPAFGKVASLSRMSEDGVSPSSTPSRGTSQRGTPPRSFKRPSTSEDETEEQARAAEAFRKGFAPQDEDSDSDDDAGAMRPKRLQIRIKARDASAPSVKDSIDVDKLKEATKAFKLGDPTSGPLALPPRPGTGSRQSASSKLAPPQGLPAPQPMPFPAQLFSQQPDQQPPPATATGPFPPGSVNAPPPQAGPGLFGQLLPFVPQNTSLQLPNAPQQPSAPQNGGPQDFTFPDMGVPPQAVAVPGLFPQAAPSPAQPPLALPGPGAALALRDDGVPPQGPPSTGPIPDLGLFSGPASFAGTSRGGSAPSSVGPLSSSGFLDLDGLPGSGAPTSTGPPPKSWDATAGGPLSVGAEKVPPAPISAKPGEVPRGAPASTCFKTGVAHVEANQLRDALACFDEAFAALGRERGGGKDVKAQAKMASHYKQAALLLQEIARLQRLSDVGTSQVGAREEMARLSRLLSAIPLQAKHRISCIRTAIKRNMDVQNYAFAKRMLDLLVAKAPPNKQGEFKVLISVCTQKGLVDRAIDGPEDITKFDAATLGRLPTIGHDTCDFCGANFGAGNASCSVCGIGSLQRSDAASGTVASPFG